ncbi:MAG: ATP F0F1 synthase subunit B [Methylocystis sp.]|jgi:F-type H+-transporting ATPase subunit b
MELDAELFVAAGFALFLGVLIKVGAHSKLFGALDARSNRIKNELAEAQKLRSEAEALLASFEQKRKDAEAEAAAIVAQAKSEAEMIAVEARKRLEEFVARGDKQIRDKIGQAEAQAVAEVRSAAADSATRLAEAVLRSGVAGGKDFVADGIRELRALAH